MSSSCFQNALTEPGLLGEGSRICVNQCTVRQRLASVLLSAVCIYFRNELFNHFMGFITLHYITFSCISCTLIYFHMFYLFLAPVLLYIVLMI